MERISMGNPLPVGQRPRCLHCQRELRPNYNRTRPPMHVKTGESVPVRVTYGTATPKYEDAPLHRPLTKEERKQFIAEHPPIFRGTYGAYRDNRFCGLRCGYEYAIAHTSDHIGGYRRKP